MTQEFKKSLIRKEFYNLREKEVTKKQSIIYLEVENFLEDFLLKNPLKRKLSVGIYWPLKGEVDLRNLKDTFNLQFVLPCCNNKKEIQYREWKDQLLKKDVCGIPAPTNEPLVNPENIGIIFVPALAIDKNGNRLGYGGGYFDNLRSNSTWRAIVSPVVLPQICVSKSTLPKDPWDIPFESWITENGINKI